MNKSAEKNEINRRSFVKKSAAAGAGLIFAPMIMRQARANDSNDLNIALLGAGAQGNVLMNACLKSKNIKFFIGAAAKNVYFELSENQAG